MFNKIKNLPVLVYSVIYAFIGMLLVLSVMLVLSSNTKRASDSFKQSITLAAQENIQRALRVVEKNSKMTGEGISEWQEAQHQINNPGYYTYWKDNRLNSFNDQNNSHIVNIDLYNAEGKSLSNADRIAKTPGVLADVSHFKLPHNNIITSIIVKTPAGIFYTDFIPIMINGTDPTQKTLIGWVGITVDLKKGVISNLNSRYIDISTLKFNIPDGIITHEPQITFKVKLPKEMKEFSSMVKDTEIQLLSILAIGSLISIFLMYKQFVHPLHRLTTHIKNMDHENPDPLADDFVGTCGFKELKIIGQAVNDNHAQILQLTNDLRANNKSLLTMANNDALTNIPNRRAYDDDWNHILHDKNYEIDNVSLLLIDCNDFKPINDTYGHVIGDLILQTIASLLSRSISTRRGDKVYRIGGDEFIIIIPNGGHKEANIIANRCIDSVHSYAFDKFNIKEPVRISIGFASCNRDNEKALSNLKHRADIAMYQAKQPSNKNIVSYKDTFEIQKSIMSTRETSAVFQALKTGDGIEMHYQPIVNADNKETQYYESLVRIRDEQGLIYPGDIFNIVEAKKFDVDFDRQVITSVFRDISTGHIPKGTGISINMTGISITNKKTIGMLLKFAEFVPDYTIVIEITETSLVRKLDVATKHLEALRSVGFKIALDDFGSGYSSMVYLANMPIDIVKFDKQLIDELLRTNSKDIIVTRLVPMIRELGYELVAEGCECDDCVTLLNNLDVTHIQGYYFGRPERIPENASCKLVQYRRSAKK